jgi:hypothetical protein
VLRVLNHACFHDAICNGKRVVDRARKLAERSQCWSVVSGPLFGSPCEPRERVTTKATAIHKKCAERTRLNRRERAA